MTVCSNGIGRYHCGLNSAGEPNARSGIDNVRVPSAIDFNELLGITRGRECNMFEKNRAGIKVAEFIYIAQLDLPADLARRWSTSQQIAIGRHVGTRDAIGLEHGHRLIHSVALGNATEIQLQIGHAQGDRSVDGIKRQLLIAYTFLAACNS